MIGSYGRPMYPVGDNDCPDGCGARVGEGCYNVEREPMVWSVIMNLPDGGLDSVHQECEQAALDSGWTREVRSRSPKFEFWYRDCPMCHQSLTAPPAR